MSQWAQKKRNKIVIIQKEIEKVDDHVEYRVLYSIREE